MIFINWFLYIQDGIKMTFVKIPLFLVKQNFFRNILSPLSIFGLKNLDPGISNSESIGAFLKIGFSIYKNKSKFHI